MQMIAALRPFYPKVKVALHAGELAPGLVPPDGLSFHVRSAVETAGAQRVGHGVDVMYETDPNALLREMAALRVLVEVNLTSNDVVLNVKGDEHPLPLYLRYDVPLTLSTDDEGVSRIDLTHEYERAAETYHLSYLRLKEFARNSIEYSFLEGESLWVNRDYRHVAKPCQAELVKHVAAGACAQFLTRSERARQQWELERRFTAFEARQAEARSVPWRAAPLVN
jgi:adenosine deaminase